MNINTKLVQEDTIDSILLSVSNEITDAEIAQCQESIELGKGINSLNLAYKMFTHIENEQ